MFFLLKLSALTCLFYLGVTVLMEAAIFSSSSAALGACPSGVRARHTVPY